MMRDEPTIRISLLVDDGAPVNVMHWLHPETSHRRLVSNRFTRRFGEVCAAHGARGKFSVLPMPCALGRIDRGLTYVPPRHRREFLRIVRSLIAPNFDITPELLTHSVAVDTATGAPLHLYEDEWVARADKGTLVPYIEHALRILKNVGLTATGVTSPWGTGVHNEDVYVRAIADAQWRVSRRRRSWYFLHTIAGSGKIRPWIAWRNRRTGQSVVSIPGNTNDEFWRSITAKSARGRRLAAERGADALLARDGKSGQIPWLLAQKDCPPVTILTHWQSLFSDGSAAGLRGLEMLFRRLRDVYGQRLRWMRCSELAELTWDYAESSDSCHHCGCA
jgi:hypothetical protein